ncbi:nitrate/nitrite two-component system sensor histidine kinase NarQ [Conservatibacter flavescens]|uniref:Sensor protein n=1 Tax=Conservatibacter flavescens TaxID=28161 RepID=A0A2M8S4U7_9PAST|nr:nitrate/nitrite two-component system sensor histidine kinase NarQ [Conservatibacter flavescens]PJG86164.1 nitrate/nitrite two-component system sensor histidine kinase NarQ [Conservatibacter flavescens]
MRIKRSVSTRIAHYLLIIIVFAGLITTLSFVIMTSNRSDAESINVSGSLRMQSYRLIYEIQNHPDNVERYLQQYQTTLHTHALTELNNSLLVPNTVKTEYQSVIQRWQTLENYIRHGDIEAYQQNIEQYVAQLDKFVYVLQQFAEKKLTLATTVISVSMLLIVAMVSYVIWYTHKQVVKPLHRLARASSQVQMRMFNHISLDTNKNDELGMLALVFTQMASDLQKLYSALEKQVDEKTKKLSQVNRSLSMLYYCSQQLSGNELDRTRLQQVLNHVLLNEHLRSLEVHIYQNEQWNIHLGKTVEALNWQTNPIDVEGQVLGELRWQAGLPCPDYRTMQNIAQMLGRALYFSHTQRQQQQLLLMEERAIIARELHDSLAQVLSFLQIQLTRLKHTIRKNNTSAQEKSLEIITEFEQALSDGYIQLRELLATFRLTIQEANLQLALEQVIENLQNQTEIKITLACSLPSQTFNAQQQVHALQIVREAILNAIKHSQASLIEVIAHTNEDGENELIVQDNGIGIPSLEEPSGHYGLNIMHERAKQLNAHLSIQAQPTGGTQVKITLPSFTPTNQDHT